MHVKRFFGPEMFLAVLRKVRLGRKKREELRNDVVPFGNQSTDHL